MSGLYFEGCRWDYENRCIGEQYSKQLFSKVPIIWLKPKESRPVSPTTVKTKMTGGDTATVSAKAGVPTQATAFRRKQLKSENHKNETESSNIEATLAGGGTIDPHDNISNDLGSNDSFYECPLYRTTARYGTL